MPKENVAPIDPPAASEEPQEQFDAELADVQRLVRETVARYEFQVRKRLDSACADLDDPINQAEAVRALSWLVASPTRRHLDPVHQVLVAVAELIERGRIDELSKSSRPRSILSWAESRIAEYRGLPIDRFIRQCTQNWEEWKQTPEEFAVRAMVLDLVTRDQCEAAERRVRRLVWEERELGKPLTVERVVRAVVGRSKFSVLEKRADRELASELNDDDDDE